MEQLLLFNETREEKMEREIQELKTQNDKVRKSLFAKYHELMTLYLNQSNEIDQLRNTVAESQCQISTSSYLNAY